MSATDAELKERTEIDEVSRHLEWLATKVQDEAIRRQLIGCASNVRQLKRDWRIPSRDVHPAYQKAC